MARKVLVVNCGSSSIKYRLFDMAEEVQLAGGLIERIGQRPAVVHHRADNWQYEGEETVDDYEAGIRRLVDLLADEHAPVLSGAGELMGVGHRVVHGGESFRDSTIVDEEVLKVIEACCELAPLHNPANLAGILAAQKIFPGIAQVAVFDTAFFQTLPERAYMYAVPYEWYEKWGIRRYGFHGTSHRYVSLRAAKILGKDRPNLITLHLGNGCSMACIKAGQAIDTTMGLTPLEGLVMGTRSGDIDPAIVFHLAERVGMSYQDVRQSLEKRSGLLGISGVSRDMRDVKAAADEGNPRAKLALEVFAHRVRKYIGAFLAELGNCDALVFTGGIGENAAFMREMMANESAKGEARISTSSSPIAVLVVPTNEELMIARDTARLVEHRVATQKS